MLRVKPNSVLLSSIQKRRKISGRTRKGARRSPSFSDQALQSHFCQTIEHMCPDWGHLLSRKYLIRYSRLLDRLIQTSQTNPGRLRYLQEGIDEAKFAALLAEPLGVAAVYKKHLERLTNKLEELTRKLGDELDVWTGAEFFLAGDHQGKSPPHLQRFLRGEREGEDFIIWRDNGVVAVLGEIKFVDGNVENAIERAEIQIRNRINHYYNKGGTLAHVETPQNRVQPQFDDHTEFWVLYTCPPHIKAIQIPKKPKPGFQYFPLEIEGSDINAVIKSDAGKIAHQTFSSIPDNTSSILALGDQLPRAWSDFQKTRIRPKDQLRKIQLVYNGPLYLILRSIMDQAPNLVETQERLEFLAKQYWRVFHHLADVQAFFRLQEMIDSLKNHVGDLELWPRPEMAGISPSYPTMEIPRFLILRRFQEFSSDQVDGLVDPYGAVDLLLTTNRQKMAHELRRARDSYTYRKRNFYDRGAVFAYPAYGSHRGQWEFSRSHFDEDQEALEIIFNEGLPTPGHLLLTYPSNLRTTQLKNPKGFSIGNLGMTEKTHQQWTRKLIRELFQDLPGFYDLPMPDGLKL